MDNKPLLSLSMVPALSPDEEQVRLKLIKNAKDTARPEQQLKQESWIEARVGELLLQSPKRDREKLEHVYRKAIEGKTLDGDFCITLDDGTSVTIGEITDAPTKYHGRRCHDPLDPSYQNDKRVGYINTNCFQPYIYSHAHGGQRFSLNRPKPVIEITPGEVDKNVKEIVIELAKGSRHYRQAGNVVKVIKTGLLQVSPDSFFVSVHETVCVVKTGRDNTYIKIDLPIRINKSAHAYACSQGLKVLKGICRFPTLRCDGSILDQEGYDEITNLYLLKSGSSLTVPENPSLQEIRDSLARLWLPFQSFPFESELDQSIFLSALLTAVIRKSLPTAPAYAFDASTPGSGKTLLATCLSVLCGEQHPRTRTFCANEEEWKKSLLAASSEDNSYLLYDNVSKRIQGDALNAFLTAPVFAGRTLGRTAETTAPTNMMLVFTGNNISMVGDINRRILKCRVEPNTESPEKRKFTLDPLQFCKDNQERMIVDALTLIRGFITYGTTSLSSTGSFDDWDKLVRQTVIWLDVLNIITLVDPNISFTKNASDDVEKVKLSNFLKACLREKGPGYHTISELISADSGSSTLDNSYYTALRESLGGNEHVNPKSLSWYARKSEGRIADGHKLVRGAKRCGVDTWSIERV